jgi:hypothetical protein
VSASHEVSAQAGVDNIACAGVHLCIPAGESEGGLLFVLGSWTPLKAGRSWRVIAARVGAFDGDFSAASCPSARLRVISDGARDVATSTQPTLT